MSFDMEKYVDKLYNDVKFQFSDTELSTTNIVTLMRIAMETVDKYRGLEGRQKKVLVIRVLHKAVEDFVIEEIDNEALHIFVDKMVDVLIDHFIDINFGNLHVNEDCHNKLKKIFPCMYH